MGRLVLPHAAEPLANRDLFLREIFRYVLAVMIFSCHGCCPRLWKKKGNCYGVSKGREVQRAEAIAGVDVLEARGDRMVDISRRAKASPINGRGSVVLPVPRENAAINDRGGI